jgi:hypothetical protein
MGITYHQVINLVNTTFEGFYQSASAYHSIKLHRDIGLAQLVENQLLTKVLLLDDIVETGQLVGTMHDGAHQYGRLVLKDSNLCGGRTRIYN